MHYFLNAKPATNYTSSCSKNSLQIILDTCEVLRHLTDINNSRDNSPKHVKNPQERSTWKWSRFWRVCVYHSRGESEIKTQNIKPELIQLHLVLGLNESNQCTFLWNLCDRYLHMNWPQNLLIAKWKYINIRVHSSTLDCTLQQSTTWGCIP